MKLPASVRVRALGFGAAVTTVEAAIGFIDRHLTEELARLPRWNLARALFLEAQRTGKLRDTRQCATSVKLLVTSTSSACRIRGTIPRSRNPDRSQGIVELPSDGVGVTASRNASWVTGLLEPIGGDSVPVYELSEG